MVGRVQTAKSGRSCSGRTRRIVSLAFALTVDRTANTMPNLRKPRERPSCGRPQEWEGGVDAMCYPFSLTATSAHKQRTVPNKFVPWRRSHKVPASEYSIS